MDPTVLVAIIFACSTLIAPILLSQMTARQIRRGKEQDYARQDAVAEKVEKASKDAAESARTIVAANDRIAVETRVANQKLDVIHTLVNSQMTAAMQSELDATTRELAMMREVIGLNSSAGRQPTDDSMRAIVSTEEKIRELGVVIAERHRQDDLAAQQGEVLAEAVRTISDHPNEGAK